MRVITGALSLLFIALVLSTVVLLSGALALGLGWVLNKIFPVTVFQGSMVAVGVGVILVLYLTLTDIQNSLRGIQEELASPEDWLDELDWGDEEVWDDEEDWGAEEEDEELDENGGLHRAEQMTFPPRPVVVGRNDPCPCGSGRKYKNCCGRSQST